MVSTNFGYHPFELAKMFKRYQAKRIITCKDNPDFLSDSYLAVLEHINKEKKEKAIAKAEDTKEVTKKQYKKIIPKTKGEAVKNAWIRWDRPDPILWLKSKSYKVRTDGKLIKYVLGLLEKDFTESFRLELRLTGDEKPIKLTLKDEGETTFALIMPLRR